MTTSLLGRREVYAFGIVAGGADRWDAVGRLLGGAADQGYDQRGAPTAAELAAVPSGQMAQRCWAQEPKARPAFAQLATELGTALRRAAGLPPSSEPSTWSPVKDRLKELVDLTADSTERAAVEAAFARPLAQPSAGCVQPVQHGALGAAQGQGGSRPDA